jgi:neutral ceramidase
MTVPLQVGAAAVNITAPVGNYLQGYTRGRPSIGVHLDIYAKALVFDDGTTKAAVVTTDLIGLEQGHVAAMRAEVARWTDIPPAHVLINASHSHGGPTVQGLGHDPWGWLWGNPADPDFGRELAKKIGGLVAMADRHRRPVAVGLGLGAAHFNINRRLPTPTGTILGPNPAGVVDHRVNVLKIVDLVAHQGDGGERPSPAPLAVLFQFTCHPTIMAMANLEISPDYPGVAQAFVEEAFGGGPTSGTGLPDGPGTLALFAQGCCGDIRPNLTPPDGSTFRPGTKQDAHRLGRILGAEVVKVCEETPVAPAVGPVRVASTRVTLPYVALPGRDELERLVAVGGTMTHGGHLDTAGQQFGDATWARHVLARMDAGPLPTGIEVEVQAVRVGDLCLVGLPGETFTEIGRQIERAIPGRAFILGYSNGNHGYFCTQESYAGGGYEPAFSWMLYMHPAQYEPSNEHLLVRAGQEVAARVLA